MGLPANARQPAMQGGYTLFRLISCQAGAILLLLSLLFVAQQLLQAGFAVVQRCTAVLWDFTTLWDAVCSHKEAQVATFYLLAIGSTTWLVEHATWYTYSVYCRPLSYV